MKKILLEIKNLNVSFNPGKNEVKAVRNLNLEVYEGEILGIVGESGSGKSVTAYSVLGLIPEPPGKTESDGIIYKGEDLRKLSFEKMRKIRGRKISMVFQEPGSSLNPVMTIRSQMTEIFRAHTDFDKETIPAKSVELLRSAGIPDPGKRINEYPGSLSGGMQQRVMIAMALACNPSLLIADEPTTSLDVTVQAQILDLIQSLKDENKITSVILITHNMGIVAEMCSRVAVMFGGVIVELAGVKEIFENPLHPYTKNLLESIPVLGKPARVTTPPVRAKSDKNTGLNTGCVFRCRCASAMEVCGIKEPSMKEISGEHSVRCFLYE
ncbi:MAG: ABC transporter ATP-binding protein [Bacteroidetes bacterium]|nr:ABC transporter ATP-binding protein [Bacteroidota bacterium]